MRTNPLRWRHSSSSRRSVASTDLSCFYSEHRNLIRELSRVSKEQPLVAKFILRVSNVGPNRRFCISPVYEKLLRTIDDCVWHVDSSFHGRFTIDVEFLDIKNCPLNGGEASPFWPTDATMLSISTQTTLCLSRMLEESILSDVTIHTADGTLSAHKAILLASSNVFKSMFLHDLKEKESSTIHIDDMSRESCMALLSYLYGNITQEDFWKHRLALLGAANKAPKLFVSLSVELISAMQGLRWKSNEPSSSKAWRYGIQSLIASLIAFVAPSFHIVTTRQVIDFS